MLSSKAILSAAMLLALSSGMSAAETAVAETKLNLRSGPGPAFNVVVVMEQGTKVAVQKCHRTWCRVKLGSRVGYTSRAYLRFGSEAYASAVSAAPELSPPPPSPQANAVPVSTGPRIWRWRDADWRNRHWRKFGWQNRHASR